MFFHIDPNSKLAKVILVLGGLPLGMAGLCYELIGLVRSYQSLNWPVSNGVVLSSVAERHRDVHGLPHSTAKIHYGYIVAGRHYQSQTIGFTPARGVLTWGYADRKVEKYPKGQAVDVRYDPDGPEQSCLEPGTVGFEDGLILLLCVAGIGFGTNHLAKWVRRIFVGVRVQ